MGAVTDPALVAQLNAMSAGNGGTPMPTGNPVTDPALVQQLEEAQRAAEAGISPDQLAQAKQSRDYKMFGGFDNTRKSMRGSALTSFLNGIGVDPLTGITQMVAHAGNSVGHALGFNMNGGGAFSDQEKAYYDAMPAMKAAVEQQARNDQGRTGTDWAHIAGMLMMPVPGGPEVSGLGNIVARGALQGGAAAALQPVESANGDDGSFIKSKIAQALMGGVTGGAVNGILGKIANGGAAAGDAANAVGPTEQTLNAADALGMPVGLGVASRNRALGMFANASANTPGGGSLVKSAQALMDHMEGVRDATADSIASASGNAPAKDAVGVGQTVQRGLGNFVDDFKSKVNDLYEKVAPTDDGVIRVNSDGTAVTPGSEISFQPLRTIMALNGRADDFSPGMKDLGSLLQNPRLKAFQDAMLEKDSNGFTTGIKNMTFDDAKLLRSQLGEMMGNSEILNDVPHRELSKVYSALTDDMQDSVAHDPQMLNAFNRATNYYRAGSDRINNVLSKFMDGPADTVTDRISKFVNNNAYGAAALRRSLQPEEWDAVASNIFRKLGDATPGNAGADGYGFSIGKFLTDFNKLRTTNPRAFDWSFGGTRYSDLAPVYDNMSQIADAYKHIQSVGNPSRSGFYGGTYGLAMLGAANPLLASKIIGGNFGFANLLASPKAARVLLDGYKAGLRVHQGVGTAAQTALKLQAAKLAAIVAGQDVSGVGN